MKWSICVSVLSGLVFGLAGVSVQAAEDGDSQTQDSWLMAKYDVNGDNIISADEISSKRDKIFAYMDADENGVVTFAEYQALDVRKREVVLEARYKRLDLNHDGRISAEEYRSYLGSFERFDADGDGRISADDMKAETVEKTTEVAGDDTHCLLWFCVRTSMD